MAEQLTTFYPDLLDERFESNFAIYHQRYSTNTFPTWWLAQPFRVVAHNGEINTLGGNANWMRTHEPRMASDHSRRRYLRYLAGDPSGSSDSSAALDTVFELMLRGSDRELPMVKALMMPDAWEKNEAMPDAHRESLRLLQCGDGAVGRTGGVCGFGGRWAVAGMDRNGLRPLRYTITGEGLLIVGSETGMVRIDEATVVEKGRVGPGEMIAVDCERGPFLSRCRAARFAVRHASVRRMGAECPSYRRERCRR